MMKYQLVWWGWSSVSERFLKYDRDRPLIGSLGAYPYEPQSSRRIKSTSTPLHGCVYKWRIIIGPLEIRRWADVAVDRMRAK